MRPLDSFRVFSHIVEGPAEVSSHRLHHESVEMAVVVAASGRSTEGGLYGVRVDDVELLPHHHSAARLLGLLGHKVAVIEVEVLTVLAVHPTANQFKSHLHWEYTLLEPIGRPRLTVAVHEDVPTGGVAVHVGKEEDVS